MRKAVFILQTFLTLVACSAATPLFADDEGIDWLDKYQKAIEEAKRTQKPIFLEFRCEA